MVRVNERDHIDMIEQTRRASLGEQKPFGVNGPTPLMPIPHFDLINGFIVDPMHCLDLEVM